MLSYRELWYIDFYVLCEKNLIVSSKSLINIILGIRKILHGLGRVPERWPDLLLTIFELQKSVIYKFECTLQDKSTGLVKITNGHHLWCQEDPPWIRKGSRRMRWSTFVNFRATEKCDVSICMYIVRQIQLWGQNYLWISSLVSGRSSMNQEGFLNDEQTIFIIFLCYIEVWHINLYVLCETNPMNGVIKITYWHHPCCQEEPPWIRKGSWMVTRSTVVNFLPTYKCDIIICMYFVRWIQLCGQS